MAFDAHANLAIGQISVAPSPALSGTSLIVGAGQGALFPAAPFNCTVWPPAVVPLQSNGEIVRVTAVVGDTMTITRAQEGTTAKAIKTGWQIANTISVKVITDLEGAVTALPQFAVQSISAGGAAATGPQVIFSNSNNVSFGVVGNTLTASVSIPSAGGAAISAGANSQSTGTVVFSNSNGVTFGLDGAGIMTASVGTAAGGVGLSAGTQSVDTGTVVFSNSNGVTFGMAGSTRITASYSQSQQVFSAANGSASFTTLAFLDSGNVSWSTMPGGIAAFVAAQTVQPVAASASNGSFVFSTLGFSNANGVTFGTSAGSIVTASVAAGGAPGSVSAGTESFQLGQVVFADSNNISFGLDAGTLTASVFQEAQVELWISAGTEAQSTGTVIFSNSNNVTFGLNTNGVMTASASVATSLTAINVSAGTASNNLSAITFSNANNVSFGLAGSVITASASGVGGGGGAKLSYFEPYQLGANSSLSTQNPGTNFISPLIFPAAVSMTQAKLLASFSFSVVSSNLTTNLTCQHGYTHNFALYSRSVTDSGATNFSNSTNLVSFFTTQRTFGITHSFSSNSHSMTWQWGTGDGAGNSSYTATTASATWNNQASATGQKFFTLPVATSLTAGEYWMVNFASSSSGGNVTNAAGLMRLSMLQLTEMTNTVWAEDLGQTGGSTNGVWLGAGFISNPVFPAASIGMTEIRVDATIKRLHVQFAA